MLIKFYLLDLVKFYFWFLSFFGLIIFVGLLFSFLSPKNFELIAEIDKTI